MSSRNVYLSARERDAAPELYRVMQDSARHIRSGDDIGAVMAGAAARIAAAGFALDYLEVRHADTLAPISSAKGSAARLLVAARLGKTRLIDNVAI